MNPRRGYWTARVIWWPLLRGLVAVGLTLTSLFVAALGALSATRARVRGLPLVSVLGDLVLLPLYLLLVMVYGLVFIGLTVVSLFAVRQGVQAVRPEFMRPSSRPRSGPIRHVDIKVTDVD